MTSLRQLDGLIHPIRGKKDSLFVACTSYEERSTAASTRLSDAYSVARAVVFRSKEYAEKGSNPENFRSIVRAVAGRSTSEPCVIDFEIGEPMHSLYQFQTRCEEWNEEDPIVDATVDISTFPRQELLVLLRVLDNLAHRPMIRLLYTEPQEYATERAGGWLTRGVRSVRSIPGFGGVQPPSKKKLLIISLGHGTERTAITWKRHQPDDTILIAPHPGYRDSLTFKLQNRHPLLFGIVENTQLLYRAVPARGIDEMCELIVELRRNYHESHFLVVAPLGTKLQTIGIYLAARLHPDVQITYAVPAIYNWKDYSAGVGPMWEFYLQPVADQ